MRFFKWLWRALTRVSIEVDAEGNCRVYPCLIGYFKYRKVRKAYERRAERMA